MYTCGRLPAYVQVVHTCMGYLLLYKRTAYVCMQYISSFICSGIIHVHETSVFVYVWISYMCMWYPSLHRIGNHTRVYITFLRYDWKPYSCMWYPSLYMIGNHTRVCDILPLQIRKAYTVMRYHSYKYSDSMHVYATSFPMANSFGYLFVFRNACLPVLKGCISTMNSRL